MLWVKTHFLFGKKKFFPFKVALSQWLNYILLANIIGIFVHSVIIAIQDHTLTLSSHILTISPTHTPTNTHKNTYYDRTKQSALGLTRDVGGDLSERCLAKPLGGSGPDRHQVGGSRMQSREHVVRLVPQLGHGAARTRHVNAGVWRLDALVADLETGKRWIKTYSHADSSLRFYLDLVMLCATCQWQHANMLSMTMLTC